MKSGLPDVPTWQDFLSKVRVCTGALDSGFKIITKHVKDIARGTRIGIDPSLISASNRVSI
jgi:hypothetical protein